MREMLKRRQFIFGKQNINRHQPYVYAQYDASSILDEGDVDAVMKFAPTKKQVIDVITDSDTNVVYNISENDIEFVDTFIYYVKTQLLPGKPKIKAVSDGNNGPYAYHVGYMYRVIGGTITLPGGEVQQMANPNDIALFPGPILIYKGKLAKLNITTEAINLAEDFPYLSANTRFFPMDIELELQLKNNDIENNLTVIAMALGFDIEATENESLIPENVLPSLGGTVEVTSDTVKYIEHKVQIGVDTGVK